METEQPNASGQAPTVQTPLPPAMQQGTAFVPALLFGAIAAAIGAAVWAGITIATDYEVGYVAWGLGGLVGIAVAKGAQVTNPATGVLAGALALGGLAAAKVLIFAFGTMPAVADELVQTPGALWGAAYEELVEEGKVSEDVQAFFESEDEEPPAAIASDVEATGDAVFERINSWDDAKKREVAEAMATQYAESVPITDLLNLGVFDLLWVFLAVGTAWQIASRQTMSP
ncbi:MAG: hypothetical protein AAF658_02175 [Myxococcota bacterium]